MAAASSERGRAPIVRLFTKRDQQAVLGFQHEIYERNFPGFAVDAAFLKEYNQQLHQAVYSWTEQLWVLDDGGEVCGFLWACLVSTMVEPRVGHIKSIYVSPALRGQGWGRRLLAVAEEWARENGATKIALDASVCNATAVSLYLSEGYEVVRHHMEKRLIPPDR